MCHIWASAAWAPKAMKPQGAIYNATDACRKGLAKCVDIEELMQDEWAENGLADFNLWASGVGASALGRASLDARLALRPDARDTIANLLQVLTAAVEECKSLGKSTLALAHRRPLANL